MSNLKKFLAVILLFLLIIATIIWFNLPKITPYYTQLTKPRLGLNLDLHKKKLTSWVLINVKSAMKTNIMIGLSPYMRPQYNHNPLISLSKS